MQPDTRALVTRDRYATSVSAPSEQVTIVSPVPLNLLPRAVSIGSRPERRPESAPHIDPPGQHFSSAVTAATSMFGDGTRRKIYLFARYLDVTVATASGRTGRPSKRYRSNGRPIDLEFPARRHDLMATLLGRALELLPDDVAKAMAEEVGEHYGRELAEQMQPGAGHRSMQSALHAVADALTAHGFAAHTEERADGTAIVSGQCPFGDLSAQHPVICAVDRGIVRGMLSALHGDGGDPEQSASRSAGDAECVTTV
jgi:predicted ArsR family transcriptional regulator